MSMQRIKNVHAYHPNPDSGPCTVVLENGRQMEMNCSPHQFMKGFKAYNQGKLMQDAFPFLSADEREFLMSGLTREDWTQIFGNGR